MAVHHCWVVGLRKKLVILLKMSGTLFVQSDHLACSARPDYLEHFSLSIVHLVVKHNSNRYLVERANGTILFYYIANSIGYGTTETESTNNEY